MGFFTRARVRARLPLALSGVLIVTGVTVSAHAMSVERTAGVSSEADQGSGLLEPASALPATQTGVTDVAHERGDSKPVTPDVASPKSDDAPNPDDQAAPGEQVPAPAQASAAVQEPLAGAGTLAGTEQVSSPRPVITPPQPVAPVTPGTVGVPAGTALTVHQGDLTITTAGAVISNLDIRGFVRVEAPNVTIKNSIIRGRATSGDAILLYAGTGKSPGLRVIDSEIAPTHHTPRTNGVYGYGFTLTRVDIHHVIDSVHIFGDNVTVENSRLRDNLHYTNDPYHSDGSHDDNIQIQVGRNIRIVGNTISGAYNAAVQITQDRGTVADVTITGNSISGGGCTINVAEKGKGAIAGLTIAGNSFGSSRFTCHMLIPPTTALLGTVENTVAGGGTLTVVRRAQ